MPPSSPKSRTSSPIKRVATPSKEKVSAAIAFVRARNQKSPSNENGLKLATSPRAASSSGVRLPLTPSRLNSPQGSDISNNRAFFGSSPRALSLTINTKDVSGGNSTSVPPSPTSSVGAASPRRSRRLAAARYAENRAQSSPRELSGYHPPSSPQPIASSNVEVATKEEEEEEKDENLNDVAPTSAASESDDKAVTSPKQMSEETKDEIPAVTSDASESSSINSSVAMGLADFIDALNKSYSNSSGEKDDAASKSDAASSVQSGTLDSGMLKNLGDFIDHLHHQKSNICEENETIMIKSSSSSDGDEEGKEEVVDPETLQHIASYIDTVAKVNSTLEHQGESWSKKTSSSSEEEDEEIPAETRAGVSAFIDSVVKMNESPNVAHDETEATNRLLYMSSSDESCGIAISDSALEKMIATTSFFAVSSCGSSSGEKALSSKPTRSTDSGDLCVALQKSSCLEGEEVAHGESGTNQFTEMNIEAIETGAECKVEAPATGKSHPFEEIDSIRQSFSKDDASLGMSKSADSDKYASPEAEKADSGHLTDEIESIRQSFSKDDASLGMSKSADSDKYASPEAEKADSDHLTDEIESIRQSFSKDDASLGMSKSADSDKYASPEAEKADSGHLTDEIESIRQSFSKDDASLGMSKSADSDKYASPEATKADRCLQSKLSIDEQLPTEQKIETREEIIEVIAGSSSDDDVWSGLEPVKPEICDEAVEANTGSSSDDDIWNGVDPVVETSAEEPQTTDECIEMPDQAVEEAIRTVTTQNLAEVEPSVDEQPASDERIESIDPMAASLGMSLPAKSDDRPDESSMVSEKCATRISKEEEEAVLSPSKADEESSQVGAEELESVSTADAPSTSIDLADRKNEDAALAAEATASVGMGSGIAFPEKLEGVISGSECTEEEVLTGPSSAMEVTTESSRDKHTTIVTKEHAATDEEIEVPLTPSTVEGITNIRAQSTLSHSAGLDESVEIGIESLDTRSQEYKDNTDSIKEQVLESDVSPESLHSVHETISEDRESYLLNAFLMGSYTEISVDPILPDPSTMESIDEDENIAQYQERIASISNESKSRDRDTDQVAAVNGAPSELSNEPAPEEAPTDNPASPEYDAVQVVDNNGGGIELSNESLEETLTNKSSSEKHVDGDPTGLSTEALSEVEMRLQEALNEVALPNDDNVELSADQAESIEITNDTCPEDDAKCIKESVWKALVAGETSEDTIQETISEDRESYLLNAFLTGSNMDISVDPILPNYSSMESVHEDENIAQYQERIASISNETRSNDTGDIAQINGLPIEISKDVIEEEQPADISLIAERVSSAVFSSDAHDGSVAKADMDSNADEIESKESYLYNAFLMGSQTEISVDPIIPDPSTMQSLDEDENIERFLAKAFTLPEGSTQAELLMLNTFIKEVTDLVENGGTPEQRQDLVKKAIRDGLPKDIVEEVLVALVCGSDEAVSKAGSPKSEVVESKSSAGTSILEPSSTATSLSEELERILSDKGDKEEVVAKTARAKQNSVMVHINIKDVVAVVPEALQNIDAQEEVEDTDSANAQEEIDVMDTFIDKLAPREGASANEIELLSQFMKLSAPVLAGRSLSQKEEKKFRRAAGGVGISEQLLDKLLRNSMSPKNSSSPSAKGHDETPALDRLEKPASGRIETQALDRVEPEPDTYLANNSTGLKMASSSIVDAEDGAVEVSFDMGYSDMKEQLIAGLEEEQEERCKDEDSPRDQDVLVPDGKPPHGKLTVVTDNISASEDVHPAVWSPVGDFQKERYALPPTPLSQIEPPRITIENDPSTDEMEEMDPVRSPTSRLPRHSSRYSPSAKRFMTPSRLGGSAAAAVICRWSPRRAGRRRLPVKQQWKLSYRERTKNHPGYFDVNVFSLREMAIPVAAPHYLDGVPWEDRDVKQRFLHEHSVSFSRNWFGDMPRKRGNDKHKEPVARPDSMAMPMTHRQDRNWPEEWYTSWQSRKMFGIGDDDDYSSTGSYTSESSRSSDGQSDEHTSSLRSGSALSGSLYTRETSATDSFLLDKAGTDDYLWDDYDEDAPECGHIVNVKQKIGERISRVNPYTTSSLRRSRWRRKYFPRGTFPY
jgi:hypothetical protein